MAVFSPALTLKGFKKCCISTAVDEDDDILWNGNVSCKCREDEVTACEDGDSDTDW
jgi:uncharacterized cysteine cluster protein YcgN (CxxCxxCC family)